MNTFATLTSLGYETWEEKYAALMDIETYPHPDPFSDLESKIRWAEFCRGLLESDFTPGDIVSLMGIQFEVL